jgi:hypothetical protein
MKILYSLIVFFSLIFPFNVLSDEGDHYLNNIDANEYKNFLNEMRKTDKKRIFVDYKEDRDTRYRKLRESAFFEAREASILNQRLWEDRFAERWDRQSFFTEKVYSGSNYESDRAAKALIYGYPAKGRRR